MVSNSARALEIARELIHRESDAVRSASTQLGTGFLETVDLALASTGKIFTVGSGTSGMVARRLAHLLSVCGNASVFLHPMDALHGSAGALEAGDMIIALSKGGESSEINQLLALARERGVKVVALTAKPKSSISAVADVIVELTTSEGADPGEVIAMGSTLVAAAWGDALAFVLMHYNGYGWDKVLDAHPAGAVGKIVDHPDSIGLA